LTIRTAVRRVIELNGSDNICVRIEDQKVNGELTDPVENASISGAALES
jgi:hypothetical protein